MYPTTYALGISDAGEIVGTTTDSYTQVPSGFSYSGGTYTMINDPLGTNGTYVQEISESGEYIIGTYLDGASGFIYSDGIYTTLNFTASSVPEPTSLINLMIASLAGIGVLLLRRVRTRRGRTLGSASG